MGECSLCLSEQFSYQGHTRIGQKLSERIESFHFTHNINRFRRQMNMELEADPVRSWMRQDVGSMMVLPVGLANTHK